MAEQNNQKLVTSLVLLVIGVFLAWKLAAVILLFLTALMLAAALNPIVNSLDKNMPRSLAIAIVVSMLFVPVIGIFVSILPGLIDQIPDILGGLDRAIQGTTILPQLQDVDFSNLAQQSGQYILHSTGKITSVFANFITLIVLTAYLLIDAKSLRSMILGLVPKERRAKLVDFTDEVSRISGHYIRSNLLLSLICALVIFAGLLVLEVPYAAPLAVFAGIMDLLPLVGGLIAAIPAVILAFTISPTIGFLTVLLFLIYQQVENNILAPRIYNKALDLSPTLSLLAVIVGASLYGIPGAFISLPIAASVPAVVKYFKNDD